MFTIIHEDSLCDLEIGAIVLQETSPRLGSAATYLLSDLSAVPAALADARESLPEGEEGSFKLFRIAGEDRTDSLRWEDWA